MLLEQGSRLCGRSTGRASSRSRRCVFLQTAGVEIMRRLIGVAQLPLAWTIEQKRTLQASRTLINEDLAVPASTWSAGVLTIRSARCAAWPVSRSLDHRRLLRKEFSHVKAQFGLPRNRGDFFRVQGCL